MGRSPRHDTLKCSRCWKRDRESFAVRANLKPPTCRNVSVVGMIVSKRGEGFVCNCNECGRRYVSRSAAARRAYRATLGG